MKGSIEDSLKCQANNFKHNPIINVASQSSKQGSDIEIQNLKITLTIMWVKYTEVEGKSIRTIKADKCVGRAGE